MKSQVNNIVEKIKKFLNSKFTKAVIASLVAGIIILLSPTAYNYFSNSSEKLSYRCLTNVKYKSSYNDIVLNLEKIEQTNQVREYNDALDLLKAFEITYKNDIEIEPTLKAWICDIKAESYYGIGEIEKL